MAVIFDIVLMLNAAYMFDEDFFTPVLVSHKSNLEVPLSKQVLARMTFLGSKEIPCSRSSSPCLDRSNGATYRMCTFEFSEIFQAVMLVANDLLLHYPNVSTNVSPRYGSLDSISQEHALCSTRITVRTVITSGSFTSVPQ